MSKRVVILGAGIAGLTSAIRLREKGYEVVVLEKNKDAGGLCSGYFVNGHYIDACLHWLMGTNEKSVLHQEWVHIGALGENVNVLSLSTLGSWEYEGTTVTFYRDLDKTEEELLKISPQDKWAIHRFIEAVRDMGSIMGMLFKNKELKVNEAIRTLPSSPHILRSMGESRERYAKRFNHPAIQFAIKNAQTGYNNMFFFFDFYGLFATGNADVPEGGAYYMVQRIKQKALDLGVEFHFNTPVIELLVANGKVVGAKTKHGIVRGDHYISTIDPLYTTRVLLKGRYRSLSFDRLEASVHRRSVSSCFNVYIAVEGDMSSIDVPTILHTKPMKVGAKEVDAMLVRSYHFDPKHFIKDGKTTVSLFIDQNEDDYNYFNSLDRAHYRREKEKTTRVMIRAFLERYPQFEGKVELLDSFGPLELKEQTNTSFGSVQSYSFTDKGMFYIHGPKLRRLDNLYLCGQWMRAIGGTPTALLTAVECCKEFDKQENK